MFSPRLVALVMFLVCCSASVAFAQPTSEEIKKAEDHFRKGAEWYAQGDYAKAVVEFKFGHILAPNAMFLYNMSLAYERLGSFDEAIEVAQEAKVMGGMPDEIALRNQSRLVGFHRILSARDVASDVAAAAARAENEDPDIVIEGPKPATIERSDGITTLGWVGAGLVAVGGGFAVGGVVTNGAVNNDLEEYRTAAANNDSATYDSLKSSIAKKQTRGKLLYTIGGVAAGVGVALFVADLVVGTETVPVEAGLALGADGAGVRATLRF